MTGVYLDARNYDLVSFWKDVCPDKNIQTLIYDERNFYPKPASEEIDDDICDEAVFEASSATTSPSKTKSPGTREIVSKGGESANEGSCGKSRLVFLKRRAETEVTESDQELFAVGRGNGTRELTGQRVLQVRVCQPKFVTHVKVNHLRYLQVATILRNLSFEEENTRELAKNLTCIRFVLLCVNSSWSNLNQMGFDILSNVASDVQLEEPSEDAVTDLLLNTLSRCISSTDRFQV